jgi:hypothetical protein
MAVIYSPAFVDLKLSVFIQPALFANSCRNILQDTAAIILFSIFATVTVARQESTMKLFNTIWWWRTYPSKMDK